LNRVLIEPFIASQPRAPRERILDIDASDVPLHGDQELTQFHGYDDHSCYRPLYVFCGQALLTCSLAAQPDRRHEAFGGRDQTVGDAPAAGVADGPHYRPGRFRLLPTEALARVRTV
jgi:hypothetical protein